MKKIWPWLRDPDNRGAANFIYVVIATLCAGGWYIFLYNNPPLTNPKIPNEPILAGKQGESSTQPPVRSGSQTLQVSIKTHNKSLIGQQQDKDSSSAVNNFDRIENGVRFEKPVPQRDGNDVLVPLIILQAIPDFDETKTVYAATSKNNWLNISNPENKSDILETSILKREGNVWRAIGLAGTRFHPLQLRNSNLTNNKFKPSNFSWLRIEDLPRVYGDTWNKFSKDFLDLHPPECFLVR